MRFPTEFKLGVGGKNIGGGGFCVLRRLSVALSAACAWALLACALMPAAARAQATFPISVSLTGAGTYDLGQRVALRVNALGEDPTTLVYRWFKGGVVMPDLTTDTFVIEALTMADADLYSVLVSNPLGARTLTARITTRDVPLQITTQPVSRVMQVGQTATLMIRAVGPSLAAFGVGGTLPDPQLRLFRGRAAP
ncbi:MAG: hypothetical protein V4773_12575 [Verrucomicrobiota bacterium]